MCYNLNGDIVDKYIDKFKQFVEENYDLNNEKVKHKYNHTMYVVENSKYLCDKLNLNEEDTFLAFIIALLHDIGRFEQAKIMSTFREDITTYDHAILGCEMLFEKNLIRYFIEEDKYDEIIKTAISNHSTYLLDESKMTEKEILHSKIIRDADKLDSFRAKSVEDIYTMANISEDDIENSKITDKVFDSFMDEKTIISRDRKTGIDIWVSYIAFIYGLYFKDSLRYINDKDYINKLFDRFDYKVDNLKMKLLKNKAIEYINSKLV